MGLMMNDDGGYATDTGIYRVERENVDLKRRLGNLEAEVKALRKAVLTDDVGALRAPAPPPAQRVSNEDLHKAIAKLFADKMAADFARDGA